MESSSLKIYVSWYKKVAENYYLKNEQLQSPGFSLHFHPGNVYFPISANNLCITTNLENYD